MKDILKLFTLQSMIAIINQIKVAPSFAFDTYFAKSQKGVMGTSVNIPIKKGAGIVLESVSPNAEHLIHDEGDTYMLTVTLPRFPLESVISASDMNEIKALEGANDQAQALSQKIRELVKEHKDSFMTTIEFMSVGALFGKVMDGKGNVLFEFSSGAAQKTFTNTKPIIQSLNEIDDALVEELGTEVGYTILASRSFISGVAARATTEELFAQGQAKWISEGEKRILEVHGKKFIPYTTKYKNATGTTKSFIAENEAIVTPDSADVYKLFYGRANHTQALNKAPVLFFTATPEELPKGRGYSVVSETRPIPVCVRPGALIKLKYQTA